MKAMRVPVKRMSGIDIISRKKNKKLHRSIENILRCKKLLKHSKLPEREAIDLAQEIALDLDDSFNVTLTTDGDVVLHNYPALIVEVYEITKSLDINYFQIYDNNVIIRNFSVGIA